VVFLPPSPSPFFFSWGTRPQQKKKKPPHTPIHNVPFYEDPRLIFGIFRSDLAGSATGSSWCLFQPGPRPRPKHRDAPGGIRLLRRR
jgi:hypothetical protein